MRENEWNWGASYSNLKATNHGHPEKTQQKEVKTKIPKARKQKQPQQRKGKGKIKKIVTDYKEKGNRIRGKEKHTLKRYSAIREKMQRMSPKQDRNSRKRKMEKKRLKAIIKEIGKGEGRNERKSKFKN